MEEASKLELSLKWQWIWSIIHYLSILSVSLVIVILLDRLEEEKILYYVGWLISRSILS